MNKVLIGIMASLIMGISVVAMAADIVEREIITVIPIADRVMEPNEFIHKEIILDGDIVQIQCRRTLPITKTAEIYVRYVDINGKIVKKEKVLFMDRADDPETPEDETCTAYTDFMAGADENEVFILNAVKTKLGL